MAVTGLKYAQELEKEMAKGKPFEKAHKKAVKKAAVKIPKKKKPKQDKWVLISGKRKRSDRDEKIVKKVARKLREIFYGPKTYAKKKFRPSGRRK